MQRLTVQGQDIDTQSYVSCTESEWLSDSGVTYTCMDMYPVRNGSQSSNQTTYHAAVWLCDHGRDDYLTIVHTVHTAPLHSRVCKTLDWNNDNSIVSKREIRTLKTRKLKLFWERWVDVGDDARLDLTVRLKTVKTRILSYGVLYRKLGHALGIVPSTIVKKTPTKSTHLIFQPRTHNTPLTHKYRYVQDNSPNLSRNRIFTFVSLRFSLLDSFHFISFHDDTHLTDFTKNREDNLNTFPICFKTGLWHDATNLIYTFAACLLFGIFVASIDGSIVGLFADLLRFSFCQGLCPYRVDVRCLIVVTEGNWIELIELGCARSFESGFVVSTHGVRGIVVSCRSDG